MISIKLDPITRRDWETRNSGMQQLPTLADLNQFLNKNVIY
nr:unnamed protein product [Callosobruchus chinensis]